MQQRAYLAAVIDLFNREVVGYSLSRKANSELTKRALANVIIPRIGYHQYAIGYH